MRGIIISRKQNAGSGRMLVESPLVAKVRAEQRQQERDITPLPMQRISAPAEKQDAASLMVRGWRTTRQLAEAYGMNPSCVSNTLRKLEFECKKAHHSHTMCAFWPPDVADFLAKQANIPSDPPDGWVTAKTACLLLARSRDRLSKYIRAGKLTGKKMPLRTVGGTVAISLIFRKADILDFKKTLKRR